MANFNIICHYLVKKNSDEGIVTLHVGEGQAFEKLFIVTEAVRNRHFGTARFPTANIGGVASFLHRPYSEAVGVVRLKPPAASFQLIFRVSIHLAMIEEKDV